MTFQSSVGLLLATGIIGELIYDGPHRATPANLVSGGTIPNTVGKAFTWDATVDGEAGAGAIGAGAFAGILIHPKHYALVGTSAGGPLAPTLDLPENFLGELCNMGTMIVSLLTVGTGKIGEGIFYDDATGVLHSGTAGEDQTQITGAKISHKNIGATGPLLAIITLTDPTSVAYVAPEE